MRFDGVFPVVPTTFTENGDLDLDSQKRCVDFMIEAGSNGICILASFSEQCVLADHERELLTTTVLEHVAGRVTLIVTTTYFSSGICAERSRRAQDVGAAMVMIMPPYHGAPVRVAEPGILEAGATGAMTGGAYPDGIRTIVDSYRAGRRDEAAAQYARCLPLINYENRQCGLLACKALMKEGGVIASEAPRHPIAPMHPATRAGLIETARRLDPLVLRWGK